MSLTKDAIQHLEVSHNLGQVIENLAIVKAAAPLIAIPEGVSIKDLESFMPNRTSYRFDFSTKSIKDFGLYNKEFDRTGSKCFIDSDSMCAKSVFDLGTESEPLHQLHKSSLKLDRTSAYNALLKVCCAPISQKDAANFIEDWADNIAVLTNSQEIMTIVNAVKQLREISIEQVANRDSRVGDFSESMSAFEKIEAKNQDKIPSLIKFACVPYHGLAAREFDVRVSIITGSAKPEISLRIVKLEAQREDMAEEFKEILTELFKDSQMKTLIGSF